MEKIKKYIRDVLKVLIPNEIMRKSSFMALVSAFLILNFLGWLIAKFLDLFFLSWFSKYGGKFITYILSLIFKPFNVNFLVVFLYSIFFIIVYRFFDKKYLNKKEGVVIYEHDFRYGDSGWVKNYWGSTNPQKTNRIENQSMIFEATPGELLHENKEFGAYHDLSDGIYEGNEYEVSCVVRSEPDTTMKFQIWIHDDITGNGSTRRARFPEQPETPAETLKTIRTRFVASNTNAMRIHLHNIGGNGKIIIESVKVVKL